MVPFGDGGGWGRGKVFVCAHVCMLVCACVRERGYGYRGSNSISCFM